MLLESAEDLVGGGSPAISDKGGRDSNNGVLTAFY